MQLGSEAIKLQMRLNNPKNPPIDPKAKIKYGKPNIIIEPFFEEYLGSNSYDLHLHPVLKVYKNTIPYGMRPFIPFEKGKEYTMEDWFAPELRDYENPEKDPWHRYLNGDPEYDIRNPKFMINPFIKKETIAFEIPEEGAILNPQFCYLGSTVEYTETYNLFPYIDGKSSIGRNFILNHHTAGRGDDGFCGNWTLEIRVATSTPLQPFMRIGQIYYEEFVGPTKRYDLNPTSHYNGQMGPTPAAPLPVDLKVRDWWYKNNQKSK